MIESGQTAERAQGGGGIGGAAAEARGNGYVLVKLHGDVGDAGAEGPGHGRMGAQNEIVARVEAGRLGTADAQGIESRGSESQMIAKVGKGDDGLEQMVAIGAPAGDVQRQIDLGSRLFLDGAGEN
jgi:hypothetical protein